MRQHRGSISAQTPWLKAGRQSTRRSFLGGSLAASAVVAAPLPGGGLFAAGAQRLRVGLVGCGGRGTGAALQALAADPAVRVVALGDLFTDQVTAAATVLRHAAADRFDCPPERCFVGAEAHRGVIGSGVDVVLLAAPPHVRPLHLEAAIDAGKHVYCEKPVAIDVAGVVRAAAAAARGRAAGLALVSGFCFRHDDRMAALVARIHAGAIGSPRLIRAHAAIGLPWRTPRGSWQPPLEWQLRNWISFVKFSGGHLVERQVEAIDRASWILGDVPPVMVEPLPEVAMAAAAIAVDRGLAPTGAVGDCPAVTAVRYRFAGGQTLDASIDRREQARDRIGEEVVGTAGGCDLVRGTIRGRQSWVAGPAGPGRHQAAMTALIRSLLAGSAPSIRSRHDGATMCRSTLMAVLGGMAAASGRQVPWIDLPGDAPGVA